MAGRTSSYLKRDEEYKKTKDPLENERNESRRARKMGDDARAVAQNETASANDAVKDMARFYGGQGARYGVSLAAIAGGAALIALTGGAALPIVAGGVVAAGGVGGVAATRFRRDTHYYFPTDLNTMRVAWAIGTKQRQVAAKRNIISRKIEQGMPVDVEIAQAAELLNKSDARALKQHDKASRKLEKYIRRHEFLENTWLGARMSSIANFFGIKYFQKVHDARLQRYMSGVTMWETVMLQNNTERLELGIPANLATDKLVKDLVRDRDKVKADAAKAMLDEKARAAGMDVTTMEDYLDKENKKDNVYINEIKGRISSKTSMPDSVLISMLRDPTKVPIADAFGVLLETNFGKTYKDVDVTSKYPYGPQINWETGEVKLDKDGKPIFGEITEIPAFGFEASVNSFKDKADVVAHLNKIGFSVKKSAIATSGDTKFPNGKGKSIDIVYNGKEYVVVVEPKDATQAKALGMDGKKRMYHPVIRDATGKPQFDSRGKLKTATNIAMQPVKEEATAIACPEMGITKNAAGKMVVDLSGFTGTIKEGKLDGVSYGTENYKQSVVDKDPARDISTIIGECFLNATPEQLEQMMKAIGKLPPERQAELKPALLKGAVYSHETGLGMAETADLDKKHEILGKAFGEEYTKETTRIAETARTAEASA